MKPQTPRLYLKDLARLAVLSGSRMESSPAFSSQSDDLKKYREVSLNP